MVDAPSPNEIQNSIVIVAPAAERNNTKIIAFGFMAFVWLDLLEALNVGNSHRGFFGECRN
jgi:hypothetical protein